MRVGKVREYGFEKERFRDSRFCEPRSGLAVGVRLSSSRCTHGTKVVDFSCAQNL